MLKMNHDTAQMHIKDGDIILIHSSSTGINWIFQKLIQLFTGSPISHVGMAVWEHNPDGSKKLKMVETTPLKGKRVVPIEIYSKSRWEIIPLPPEASFQAMESMVWYGVDKHFYGFADAVTIPLREFFGLKVKDPIGSVCSELVAQLWIAAGIPLKEDSVSPGRLILMLRELGHVPTIDVRSE